eukprot:4154861-Prymnesium_polylepis.1
MGAGGELSNYAIAKRPSSARLTLRSTQADGNDNPKDGYGSPIDELEESNEWFDPDSPAALKAKRGRNG